jgi:threonine/homoserine/homoserine lactone efflux protein
MIAEGKLQQSCFFALGNTIPQMLWGCLSATALYDARHLTNGPIDTILTLIGIVVMLFISYKLFTNKDKKIDHNKLKSSHSRIKNFFFGFMLSLSAPQRVILYIIIFTGFSVRYNAHTFVKTFVGIGIGTFIGSVIAWVCLVIIFNKLSHEIKVQILTRTGAILLLLMAVVAFVSLFVH